PDVATSVDDVAVEHVSGGVAARDDLDRVPALDLKLARRALLIGDASTSQYVRLATPFGVLVGGHHGGAGFGVDPGIDPSLFAVLSRPARPVNKADCRRQNERRWWAGSGASGSARPPVSKYYHDVAE